MNKYAVILILCAYLDIVCKTVCQQDGDELGVIINNSCYCANKRDVSKIIVRVPKNGGQIQTKKPSYYE